MPDHASPDSIENLREEAARQTECNAELRQETGEFDYVQLRSVTEPIDDSSTGKFIELVLSGVAELDNNIRTERTVKGMNQRLKDGRWTFPPPLGYRAGLDATGAKTIIPDEHSAPLITQAFEEFATGLHTREQVYGRSLSLDCAPRKASSSVRKPSHRL